MEHFMKLNKKNIRSSSDMYSKLKYKTNNINNTLKI
jgi:hypothetical protein